MIVTVDTLRADAIGPYGGAVETPAFDRLAAESVRFSAARSSMPTTRPSHAALLTGRMPRETGVLSNRHPLIEAEETLAESLASQGWMTSAFVSSRILGPESGFTQGFDDYSSPERRRNGEDTMSLALEWMRSRKRNPFFTWIHLYDCHMPYTPPAHLVPRAHNSHDLYLEGEQWAREALRASRGYLSQEQLERARQLYDGEVRYSDVQLGRLLTFLDQASLDEKTLLVVTSDHGECFEKGYYFEHGECPYEGALKIPLFWRDPEMLQPPAEFDRLIDLGRLGSELFRRLAGQEAARGSDGLFFETEGTVSKGRAVTVSQLREPRSRSIPVVRVKAIGDERVPARDRDDLFAVYRDSWKLIVRESGAELFDLSADPTEQRDLAASEPETVAELQQELRQWLRAHRSGQVPQEQDGLDTLLESLGYL